MNALAALLGVLFVGAVLLLVSGLTKVDVPDQPTAPRRTAGELWAHYTRRPPGRSGRRHPCHRTHGSNGRANQRK